MRMTSSLPPTPTAALSARNSWTMPTRSLPPSVLHPTRLPILISVGTDGRLLGFAGVIWEYFNQIGSACAASPTTRIEGAPSSPNLLRTTFLAALRPLRPAFFCFFAALGAAFPAFLPGFAAAAAACFLTFLPLLAAFFAVFFAFLGVSSACEEMSSSIICVLLPSFRSFEPPRTHRGTS